MSKNKAKNNENFEKESKKLDLSLLIKAEKYSVDFYDVDDRVNSDFVKKLRNKLNMSQVFFAKVLGVSKKTIEKWEQGKNPIGGTSSRLLLAIYQTPEVLNLFYKDSFQTNKSNSKPTISSLNFSYQTPHIIMSDEKQSKDKEQIKKTDNICIPCLVA